MEAVWCPNDYDGGVAQRIYLNGELRGGDIKLLWGQDPLLGGHVLQDHSEVDQVISHHVLILSW